MKKIAVGEDNPDNRLLVRVILEPHYEVVEYASGQSTLEGLAREKPDLLLLDISLPEMDGVAVLRQIRASAELRDLPIIALTAHAMTGDREKYLGLGFDDYVTKPIVDEKVLLEAIERNLAGGRRSPAAAPQPIQVGTFRRNVRLGAETDASARRPYQPPSCMESGTLEQLRKLGGDSFTAEMIGVFLEYAARKIAQGREAFAAGDLVGVENAIHPIKSSAGNVGARQIQELAVRIEDLARNKQREPLGPLLAEIDSAFRTAKPQFEQIRNSLLKQ